jgi:hypothetical protein
MRLKTVKITRPVMIGGKAYTPGEVVEVSGGDAYLLRGLGKAVATSEAPAPPPEPEIEPEPEPEARPRKRSRARTETGQYQGDDPGTPDVNEAWTE